LVACAGPFSADDLFDEVRRSGPFACLLRQDFDRCLAFCATGGYALRAYDQWQRLIERDGMWQLRDPRMARRLRMNVGTIVGTETIDVRMGRRGGRPLGQVEEAFAATLSPGDSFLIGGQVVRYEGLREMTLQVSPAPGRDPMIAVFAGTKLATTAGLSRRVMDIICSPKLWGSLPAPVVDWLEMQRRFSCLPGPDYLLVETFPRGGRHYFTVYAFAGRNACQTLGLLISKRMEDAGLAPLGFVASDYAVMLWALKPIEDPAAMLAGDGLRQGFDAWLGGNAVMKRTFRTVATGGGLIERNVMGKRKTGRQATFSSDILYDTLMRFDPDHLMLEITRTEAQRGLVDFGRIEEMISRSGRIEHVAADRVTPFAAPLLLEAGRVPIRGGRAEEMLLDEAALRAEVLTGTTGAPRGMR
ncbi:MAG: DNA ligase-associated DEXH box helicase, partial [Pseudomonadota bacterium]